jgi:hypothetical protein
MSFSSTTTYSHSISEADSGNCRQIFQEAKFHHHPFLPAVNIQGNFGHGELNRLSSPLHRRHGTSRLSTSWPKPKIALFVYLLQLSRNDDEKF